MSAIEKFRVLQISAADNTIIHFPISHPVGHTHLTEASQEDWFWGRINANSTEEDYYWRRLSDNWAQKDVLPAAYLDIHNQVFEAYNANPMANAIIEMGVNFTLGDGLNVDAKHPKVQKLIDAFWDDPDNRMATRQFDLATELSLYGELFIRVFVNRYNGHVKLAHIDPSLVDELITDPENIERLLRIHRRALAQTTIPLVPGAPPLIYPAGQMFFDAAREPVDVSAELRKLQAEKAVPGVPPAVPTAGSATAGGVTSHGSKPNRSPAEKPRT